LIWNLFKNATFSFDALQSKLAFLGGNLLARVFRIYLLIEYIDELALIFVYLALYFQGN
jgi:hypothetical protein